MMPGKRNRIHAQETGRKSGVRSCIMSGLTTHLVQELNNGTVRQILLMKFFGKCFTNIDLSNSCSVYTYRPVNKIQLKYIVLFANTAVTFPVISYRNFLTKESKRVLICVNLYHGGLEEDPMTL